MSALVHEVLRSRLNLIGWRHDQLILATVVAVRMCAARARAGELIDSMGEVCIRRVGCVQNVSGPCASAFNMLSSIGAGLFRDLRLPNCEVHGTEEQKQSLLIGIASSYQQTLRLLSASALPSDQYLNMAYR